MSGKIQILNGEDFDEKTGKGNWIVDFWATWCGPCKLIAPQFEGAAEEAKNVIFGKVDVDAETDLAQRFGIMSIPCLVFFKDGEMVDKIVGLVEKDEILERAKNAF